EGASNAAAGTIDSWLITRLSSGRDHVTDASNASRTLLFDIGRGAWSEEMAELFDVPLTNLPQVVDSSGDISMADPASFGVGAPITGIAGDQEVALFRQAWTSDGVAQNTYGTGSFVLRHEGSRRVADGWGVVKHVGVR